MGIRKSGQHGTAGRTGAHLFPQARQNYKYMLLFGRCHVWLFATPWAIACQAPLSSLSPGVCSNLCSLSQWCYLTISCSAIPFSFCLQSLPASVFSNESALHIRWPKYWSFSFSISLSNDNSGLISFRIDWFDLLAVQGTLKSVL